MNSHSPAAAAPRFLWCQVDLPPATLPLKVNTDTPYLIPAIVPAAAREILVYAGVFCGDTTPVGTGEYEIYVRQKEDGDDKAGFFLSVNTGPASSYNNNSDNVWLPMPPDRTIHALLTSSVAGATSLGGNLGTELRVIGYRLPAGDIGVTVQPAALTCDPGQAAAFTAVVTGGMPASFQWRKNRAPLPGETAATLDLAHPTADDAGAYDVVVTAGPAVVTSKPATLTVQPISVTVQADATTFDPGQAAALTATIVAVEPATCQWQKNGAPLAGQTASVLVLSRLQPADSGAYTVVVTAGANIVTSEPVTLTIQPVGVTVQATATTYSPGQAATLTATIVAVEPATCQWEKDGAPLAGQTAAILVLANLQTTDTGAYTVVVIAGANTVTSEPVTLTVLDYAHQVMALAPLVYWPLNESAGPTVADLSGNHHAGTAEGIVAFAAGTLGAPDFPGFGAEQAVIALNGTDAAIQVPPLNIRSNHAAIVGWINPLGIQVPAAAVFFTRNSSDPADTAGLAYTGGGRADSDLCFVWNCGHYELLSGLVPRLGQWNLVALVIEPEQATFYLGNRAAGLKSKSFPLALLPGDFATVSHLGWDPLHGQNRRFRGLMAQFAFFNQALSAAQMTTLFNTARPPE